MEEIASLIYCEVSQHIQVLSHQRQKKVEFHSWLHIGVLDICESRYLGQDIPKLHKYEKLQTTTDLPLKGNTVLQPLDAFTEETDSRVKAYQPQFSKAASRDKGLVAKTTRAAFS